MRWMWPEVAANLGFGWQFDLKCPVIARIIPVDLREIAPVQNYQDPKNFSHTLAKSGFNWSEDLKTTKFFRRGSWKVSTFLQESWGSWKEDGRKNVHTLAIFRFK